MISVANFILKPRVRRSTESWWSWISKITTILPYGIRGRCLRIDQVSGTLVTDRAAKVEHLLNINYFLMFYFDLFRQVQHLNILNSLAQYTIFLCISSPHFPIQQILIYPRAGVH